MGQIMLHNGNCKKLRIHFHLSIKQITDFFLIYHHSNAIFASEDVQMPSLLEFPELNLNNIKSNMNSSAFQK